MNDRRITAVRRNEDGEIVALCNPGEAWSPVHEDGVRRHLRTGLFDYYVSEAGHKTYLERVEGEDGTAVQAAAKAGSANHLQNLPETEAAGVT